MSYFEGQSSRWSQHGRQPSWDPSQPDPRSGVMSPTSQREELNAFASQLEEIDRARENLAKSGRAFGPPGRRDSVPVAGSFVRQYSEFDSRAGGSPRHHSIDGMDGMRSHSSHSSSSIPGYLVNQRFGSRPNEAESMLQAKRKAAAHRERELRNYHQEQQYNRHLTAAKSERPPSPGRMNEEDRRELLAAQHRALYGNASSLYLGENPPQHPASQDVRVMAAVSGGPGSPNLAFDSYGVPTGPGGDNSAHIQAMGGGNQPRSRSNSTTSPATNQGQYAMYENSQHGKQGSQPSPRSSPTRAGAQGPVSGVAPIGTRPTVGAGKRNTPPMPSPLGYAYPGENKGNQISAERSHSVASNPTTSGAEKNVNIGWGGNNGWGPNKMQAPVWG